MLHIGGRCCNVSQLEADCQIAGHWLPSRNDPPLNREAARVALRQGSFEPASEASPTGGDPAPQKTGLHRLRIDYREGSRYDRVTALPDRLARGGSFAALAPFL